MKNIKFIILLIVVGIAVGAGVYVFTSKNNVQSDETVTKIELINLELDEFLINLSDSESYMKTNIAIGYDKKDKQAKDIESRTVIIRDCTIQYLMSKTKDDLSSSNLDNIKNELIETINSKLGQNIVKEIYFTALVVQ